MVTGSKNVVFDIVGTCVSYDHFFEQLDARLGAKLRAEGIKPKLLAWAWMECAEREYSYLGLSGRYVAFWPTFKPLFFRALYMAGIEEPRKFATEEDVDFVVNSYRDLKARPGVVECWKKLREAGFTVWALTSGDTTRVAGYLSNNGIEMPGENFVSCDSLGVGKPAPAAYQHLLGKFLPEDEVWFAAAHMWDSAAAKQNGFKAAWCSVWEKEPVTEVFGEIDVTADSLVEMAEKIIAASSI